MRLGAKVVLILLRQRDACCYGTIFFRQRLHFLSYMMLLMSVYTRRSLSCCLSARNHHYVPSSTATQKKLFFKNIFRPNERVQTIDDEGIPIRVSEEIRDSVRIGALRARGYEVVELDRMQVSFRMNGSVRTQWIEEYPLVYRCLQRRGVELVDIASASESDMDLHNIEHLPILRDALMIAGGLRFASIPDSKRRTITDHSGVRYINLRNPDVRNLLSVIPHAVSNPLRNRLLDVYLKLEDYRLSDARASLLELLATDNLQGLASVDAAPLTRRHVEAHIKDLLSEFE